MQKPDTASAPRPNAACAQSRPQQLAPPCLPFAHFFPYPFSSLRPAREPSLLPMHMQSRHESTQTLQPA